MDAGRDLAAAYHATLYTAVLTEGSLTLRVSEVNALLDRVLATRGVRSWAYVTAYNPGSVQVSAAENETRQRELRAAVARDGHVFYEGTGVGEGWPPEPSLLILGISEAEASALGRRFGQLAIVVGERGEAARLLWLRSDPVPK
jgi:hypothetical protein